MYRLHYMEVRYATIPPSRPLFVFRVLDQLCAEPIWISGIRFEFQQQWGKLPFIRTFRRVVLVHLFVVLSFGGRLVSILAFQWLSFIGWRFERLQPYRVPCEPR